MIVVINSQLYAQEEYMYSEEFYQNHPEVKRQIVEDYQDSLKLKTDLKTNDAIKWKAIERLENSLDSFAEGRWISWEITGYTNEKIWIKVDLYAMSTPLAIDIYCKEIHRTVNKHLKNYSVTLSISQEKILIDTPCTSARD